jgi:hypothetical protein
VGEVEQKKEKEKEIGRFNCNVRKNILNALISKK